MAIIQQCNLVVANDMCETVNNRNNSAVFEGRVNNILHNCFRVAINTIPVLAVGNLQYLPMVSNGVPASGLVEYQ